MYMWGIERNCAKYIKKKNRHTAVPQRAEEILELTHIRITTLKLWMEISIHLEIVIPKPKQT